jgi:hypothetical protein
MKILIIDIETRPSLAYVWSLWDQHVGLDQLVQSGESICWAAKWLGESKVEFRSVFHDGKDVMLKRIWELLNEADMVVHFNGRRFDVPHLNTLFLEAGMTPPAPFQQVDLMETVKHKFYLISNKLQYCLTRFNIGEKVKHEGFPLWKRCMANDAKAWAKMRVYNIGDVRETEKLYQKILPWIERHPSYGALTGKDVCPNCGSEELAHRGQAFTKTGKYQRFVCKECGKWSRAVKRIEHTGIVEVGR